PAPAARRNAAAAQGTERPRLQRERKALGLQLCAYFAALVLRAVHVDVQVAGFQRLHLGIGKLLAIGDTIGVAVLRQRDDDGAVLALGPLMDVRHHALHPFGGDAAGDSAVLGDTETAAALRLRAHRRHFL